MSVDFDGTNDYIVFTINTTGLNNVVTKTISSWIYPDTWGEGAGGSFVDKRTPGNAGWFLALDSANKALRYFSDFSTTDGEWRSETSSMNTGSWYHVAITYNRSNTANLPTFFINGSARTTTVKTQPVGTVTSDAPRRICFGADSATAVSFNGKMSETAMWNVALTDDEIKNLATSSVKGIPLQTRPDSLLMDIQLDDYPDGFVTIAGSSLFVDRSKNEITGRSGVGTSNPIADAEEILSCP